MVGIKFIPFLFFLVLIPYASASTAVTGCQVLSVDGEEYILGNNISLNSSTQCFNFSADNITLEGGGYGIYVGSVSAINNGTINTNQKTNISIKNIFLIEDSNQNIVFLQVYKSNFTRLNNIRIIDNINGTSWGFYINGGQKDSIINGSTVRASFPLELTDGVAGFNLTNITISNNIISGGTGGTCVYIDNSGGWGINGNKIYNNIINCSTSGATFSVFSSGLALNNSWGVATSIINYSYPPNAVETKNYDYWITSFIGYGNYWGKNDSSGFSDTCSDSDTNGICDSQYDLYTNGADYSPISNYGYHYGITLNPTTKLILNGTIYTTTSELIGANVYNFSASVAIPNLQGEINSTIINMSWNVSNLGRNTTQTGVINAERLRIHPCPMLSKNSTINFTVYDEKYTTNKVISVFGITFNVWIDSGYRNYSFSGSGSADYDYCIFPGWASYYANSTMSYSNTSYSTRNYFIESAQLSNTTSEVNLYLLDSTSASNIIYTVLSLTKVPQENVIVEIAKYYPSTNIYITVATGKSGDDGKFSVPLELYAYYQYTLKKNGALVSFYQNSQLTQLTKELYLSQGNYINIFDYWNDLIYGCSYNNNTKVLSCTVTDATGLMNSVYLNVEIIKPANVTQTVCSTNGTSSSVTLICNVSTWSNRTMHYYLYGNFDSSSGELTQLLEGGWINNEGFMFNLGVEGLFLAMIIIITLAFAGSVSPEGTIALSTLGFVISSLLGLIHIQFSFVIGLIVAAGILVYHVKSD